MNDKIFENLSPSAGMNPILHYLPGSDVRTACAALKDFGFSGAVTNVSGENGFTKNAENVKKLAAAAKILHDSGLEYWIYDETGYPSGQAGGITLEDHPELEAKGFYMRKFEAFLQPKEFTYEIDGDSTKIVHAAKYKINLSDTCEAYLRFDTAESLLFSKKRVKISLQPGEAAYVFIMRPAYEGAHTVHNISSRKRYIDILDKRAVKRFLEVAYAPIAAADENVYKNARAVFTDEPSVMASYAREHEVFNYALAPYTGSLFKEFKARRGYSLLPYLPLIFEETSGIYPKIRMDFYETVGELTAENYTGQINAYLKKRGTKISGHYLAEEHVWEHAANYGSYERVLEKTGYPGMDVLQCTPEDFYFNAPKFLQMIAEKKGTDGFMVEYCPFFNAEAFYKNPFENTVGSLSILYMYGARKINSYYEPNLCEYEGENALSLARFRGGLSRGQSRYLNDYVRRMYALLSGRKTRKITCVYYALEDAQSKFAPRCCGKYARDGVLTALDRSLKNLAKTLLLNGEEYVFIDADELQTAAKDAVQTAAKDAVRTAGKASAKNAEMRRIVVPVCDFLRAETIAALKKFSESGADILFLRENEKSGAAACACADGAAKIGGCTKIAIGGNLGLSGENIGEICKAQTLSFGEEVTAQTLLKKIRKEEKRRALLAPPPNVLKQSYEGGICVYYNNNKEETQAKVLKNATVYEPDTGRIYAVQAGDVVKIAASRAVILEEERNTEEKQTEKTR